MKNYCFLLGIIHALSSLNAVLPIPTGLSLSFSVNNEKPCVQKSNRDLFLTKIFNPCASKVKRQVNGANSAVVQVYEMKIITNINNKFADTVVTVKVVNTAVSAEQKIFSAILPNDAFVTGFIMDVGGKNYTSYVVENDEARKQFDSALADGVIAGYVAPSARDSNSFIISVIVEPNIEIAFYLYYQEFLKRTHGRYENIINIHPGQPVYDLSVEVKVYINETQKLKDLEVLPLQTGNEISKGSADLDPKADVVSTNSSAVIKFSPNIERQKHFARLMNTPENNGLAAQFVVQFDVEREPNGGEVLVKNGFYVNFLAPTGLGSIPKHIVFLLDTSGSMLGNKMKQLKEAMANILDQLHEKDLFHLVEFSNGATVWNLDNSNNNVLHFSGNSRGRRTNSNSNFPNAYLVNSKYIAAAKKGVNQFVAKGGTDALSALNVGLKLIETAKQNKVDNVYRQAVIVFLTDGLPNTRPDTVVKTITELNTGLKKSAIYSLSFGEDGNQDFLEKLSFSNNGTTKHIYDSSDSAKQLEKFYDEISSPVLVNVSVNYNPSQCTQMTKTQFPVLYEGSEIVVAARCDDLNDAYQPEISATSSNGIVRIKPVVKNSLTDISRLWAYLTVKELLDKKKMSNANTNEIDKEIVGLSLNYSFVTDLSPMVVASPQKDMVVGNLELQRTLRSTPYPKASNPDPNYVRPTSATTTTTTTTTETPTTTTTETPTTTKTEPLSTTAIPAIIDDRIKELFYALRKLQYLLNENELFYNKTLFNLD